MNEINNIYVTLAFLIVLYVGFCFFGGWRALGKQYRNQQNILVTASSQAGQIRYKSSSAFYRDFLNLGVSEEGLYLSITPRLLLFHPPLLIPWDAVTYAKVNSSDQYELHRVC